MMSKLNSIDLSAKLLATENISVRRANAKTASFDVKSRVLTIPLWKHMTPAIEGMLVGHEVGHALYTSNDYVDLVTENPKIFSYVNVLEDVRIEKLIKREYPGIRKTMTEGYKELNEQDFFGIKSADLNSLLLVDRINLYFKVGFSCGVKFSQEEKHFVTRAEQTETMLDVTELAKELFAFSKEELKKHIAELRLRESEEVEAEDDGGDEDSTTDFDDLYEEDEDFSPPSIYDDLEEDSKENDITSDKDGEGSQQEDKSPEPPAPTSPREGEEQSERDIEQQLESVTDKSFSKKLEELADSSTEYVYHKLDSDYPINPIISYKKILEETLEVENDYSGVHKNKFDKFKTGANQVVSYLVKEFEMKKSAQLYKRAAVAKVGSLDMKKVWSYKLSDDLFKRVTALPEGKNHGMVFLLDWSGSMSGVLDETIEQVITLAMFCNRAQIPYRVFAFSTHYCQTHPSYSSSNEEVKAYQRNRDALEAKRRNLDVSTLTNACSEFSLLEIASDKMSNTEFNTMIRRFHASNLFVRSKGSQYNLSGTPLNESLAYMIKFIPEFISNNGIEKMTFITLTDGEGTSLCGAGRGKYSLDEYRYDYTPSYTRIRQKHFIQDDTTKKVYNFSPHSNFQTETLLQMIKDRNNINVIGFYICPNRRRDLMKAIQNNVPKFGGNIYELIDDIRSNFRNSGYHSVSNAGHDDLFIVPESSMKVDDSMVSVTGDQTAAQIARRFSKVLSGRKTSRVLLNKFIGYVA